MAETNRTYAALVALLASNTAKEISAQDLRDAIYSLSQIWGGMYVTGGATNTTMTGSGTWDQLNLTDFTNHAGSNGIIPEKANNRIVLPQVAGLYQLTISGNMQGNVATGTWGYKVQLDGADVPGGVLALWRPLVANVGHWMTLSLLINYDGSSNGRLTFHANKDSLTGSFRQSDGGIWVRRVA